ncbi:MAG: sulfurtransferase TusA family protein [Bacillota bacterium]|nr:sulfurtransferase TusA family protein [Bacillota bacterium]
MKLDLQGLACPSPLMQTIDALRTAETSGEQEVLVLVDDPGARDSVLRVSVKMGWTATCTRKAEAFWVYLTKK